MIKSNLTPEMFRTYVPRIEQEVVEYTKYARFPANAHLTGPLFNPSPDVSSLTRAVPSTSLFAAGPGARRARLR